ncbi:hypothetical protein Hypma_005494 [Hypsizygus marmoreus]|uniref:Uncharacterized protein n=1 Tax=Hypsizygus marmoreus TaxID=39966 RepID=A0A369JZB9_HYPMA|nr:hypothetical protein Hypma_005494 [Hypsizygus marmoreus]
MFFVCSDPTIRVLTEERDFAKQKLEAVKDLEDQFQAEHDANQAILMSTRQTDAAKRLNASTTTELDRVRASALQATRAVANLDARIDTADEEV